MMKEIFFFSEILTFMFEVSDVITASNNDLGGENEMPLE